MDDKNYKKLSKLIEDVDKLIKDGADNSSPDFENWYVHTERFIIDQFGKDGPEYENFKNRTFTTYAFSSPDSHNRRVEACKKDLQGMKGVMRGYLEDIAADDPDNQNNHINDEMKNKSFSKVFVVYGHDGELRSETARLLEQQKITPIILQEQPKGMNTIIELIEKNLDVGSSICLFTADDVGKEKNEEEEQRRVRQNVLFETGLMVGKLGRENVIIIADKGIEMPSDLEGIIPVEREDWKILLLQELNAMGYEVDANLLFK